MTLRRGLAFLTMVVMADTLITALCYQQRWITEANLMMSLVLAWSVVGFVLLKALLLVVAYVAALWGASENPERTTRLVYATVWVYVVIWVVMTVIVNR